MSVLIKGGRVVTASDDYVGDIFIENGTISLIGESLDVPADKVIDASGKYVIPGAIDPHTHIEMFFGGTTTIDDFTSGTTAAAFGGTTTLVDFCVQAPGTSFREALISSIEVATVLMEEDISSVAADIPLILAVACSEAEATVLDCAVVSSALEAI
jgi:dihydropyrimidinase